MFNKIKNRIKGVIDLRVKLLRDQQHENMQILLNYNQLSQLFSEDSFIPFSGWAMSPSTILHVLNDITINGRKGIIEFGSGASTFYIAKLLKLLKSDAVFYCVESNEIWALELEKQLKLYDISDQVQIIFAPLAKVPPNLSFKEQEIWYDINVLEQNLNKQKEFDLILVDGPFGGSTPYARFSALPFLINRLSNRASIFLDDIQRENEAVILKEWEIILQQKSKKMGRYAFFTNYSNFDILPFQLSKQSF